MRWSYLICLLLVSAAFARPRQKRSLGYIKSLISNKLFGSKTVIIAQPILAKNQTYQLFKIPGYDDIVIKVTRINESNKNEENRVKIEDAVIVKPELAIIGSYLGTTTQKETLLAIEVTKSLLQSGILSGERGGLVQELMVPLPQYYDVPVIQDTRVPPIEYPPLVYEKPSKSHYFYKQKGAQADMTYESYNNGDVVVTRTEKEPPLPQYIKMRLAEVATIGANPYMLRQYGHLQGNRAPIPVPRYLNPGMMTGNVQDNYYLQGSVRNGMVPPEYVANKYGGPIVDDENPVSLTQLTPYADYAVYPYQLENMRRVIFCREKLGKMCPHENVLLKNYKIDESNYSDKSNQAQNPMVNVNVNKSESNANRIAVNDFLKNHSVNGQLMSQYTYKQMNHHSNNSYTEVKVGEAPKLSHEAVATGIDFNKDFVYIPPKDDSSMLSILRLHNEEVNSNIDRKPDDKNAFISKVISNEGRNYVPQLSSFSNRKTDGDSFEQNPIVVKQIDVEKRDINAEINEDVEIKDNNDEHKRGDIPGASY